jgi:hypothetical protein
MPYVFYDLPADSSELETFNGYQVSRIVTRAEGGPVAPAVDPFEPAPELVLEGSRRPWFEPVLSRAPAKMGMARRVPTRAWCMRGFMTPRAVASYLSVPSLCFTLVWLLGRF